jgi:hypothetical protein
VANFIAGVRARYDGKNKDGSPGRKFRPPPIWYILAAVFLVLLMQNFIGRSAVEILNYSQFKSLVKKDLINDLVIGETTIKGNLKGAAAKEIFQPDKLKEMTPEMLAGAKLLPFETVRVEDTGLRANSKPPKYRLRESSRVLGCRRFYHGWFPSPCFYCSSVISAGRWGREAAV